MRDLRQRLREAEVGDIDYSRVDVERRTAGLESWRVFAETYFADVFYNPFTDDQIAIGDCVAGRIQYGGLQAVAAERGGGKTTITKVVAIWAMVFGLVKWLVIVKASHYEAKRMLADIRFAFESNDLLYDDFPEICQPVRALEKQGKRSTAQKVDGKSTFIAWGAEEIVLPTVEGSAASGGIVTARSIGGQIRGLVKWKQRPDFVIADDIETKKSAASDLEIDNRIEVLRKDVIGLAGPDRSMAVTLLCTIINRKCVAYRMTDRKESPSWGGLRQRWVRSWPTDRMAWEKYIEIAKESPDDPTRRLAYAYYLANRETMDAGVDVSNPNRYDNRELPDGSRLEVSSIQSAYNRIADTSLADFFSEYQNDPADIDPVEIEAVSEILVKSRTSGIDRGVVPSGTLFLTVGIDVGKYRIHWVVVAWLPSMVGQVIDYGIDEVRSPTESMIGNKKVTKATEIAIVDALTDWRAWHEKTGYAEAGDDGEVHFCQIGLVDAGWLDHATYQFCGNSKIWRPSKGYGSTQKIAYREPNRSLGPDRQGKGWYSSWQKKAMCWLFHLNVDLWKLHAHQGFIIEPGDAGSVSLFGGDGFVHNEIAKHICAEQWVTERTATRDRVGFKKTRTKNHWLDALASAAAAADMCGASVLAGGKPKQKSISLAQLQAEKRAS